MPCFSNERAIVVVLHCQPTVNQRRPRKVNTITNRRYVVYVLFTGLFNGTVSTLIYIIRFGIMFILYPVWLGLVIWPLLTFSMDFFFFYFVPCWLGCSYCNINRMKRFISSDIGVLYVCEIVLQL